MVSWAARGKTVTTETNLLHLKDVHTHAPVI